MKNEFIVKRCAKCGAMVEVIKDCTCDNCGIKCCGEEMKALVANSVDASFEKHVPTYEVVGNYVVVTVNHVMEEKHYIEYVALESDSITAKKYFKPGEVAKAVFPYVKGSKLYAYCNLHDMWQSDVE